MLNDSGNIRLEGGERMWGLTLEGGGAKGAFQVGAYKALMEKGYEFGGFTGTSIGSLNAAMLAQGDFDKLVEIWDTLDPESIFGPGVQSVLMEEAFSLESVRNYSGELKDLVLQGGIDVGPILSYISNYIDEKKIRSSGKDFGLVTFNVSEMKTEKLMLEDIPVGHLNEYLLASSYLPVFKRSQIAGKYYLDGGFVDKLPFGLLIDKGYTDIVLIRIDGFGIMQKLPNESIRTLDITPRRDLGNLMDFNRENSRKLMQMGYLDTLVILGDRFGDRYTFSGDLSRAKDLLFNPNDDTICGICEALGMPELTGKDKFYMYVLPKIAERIGMKDRPGAEEIALELIESAMASAEMDWQCTYDIEEAVNQLMRVFHQGEILTESTSTIPGLDLLKKLWSKDDEKAMINRILFRRA